MEEKIIEECEKLMAKYGHLPFDEALPSLQKGWHAIGSEYNLSGAQVFEMYMDWKAKQK